MSTQRYFLAARRLTSAFYSGASDNVLAIVDEIDSVDGWVAVALVLTGDVASLAHKVHGVQTQQWLDSRIACLIDRATD